MRTTVYWMLLVSMLLFVASIWFLIAGARDRPPQASSAVPPVATVKQIMDGMTTPASAAIYRAVSTVITAEGTTETVPRNDQEWALVGSNAASLVESARLLMDEERAIDDEDWMRMSRALVDTGMLALKAADAQDVEALLAAGEVINASCESCHRKYAPEL